MPDNVQSFIVNTLQPRLNDPNNSQFWLPGQLTNLTNSSGPVFPLQKKDPSTAALTGSSGTYIATTLAGDWVIAENSQQPGFGTYAIPNPASPQPNVTLSDLTVYGVPNVFVQPGITSTPNAENNGYTSQATLQFNYYPSPQQELKVTGSYELDQAVCTTATQSGATCDGNHYDTVDGQGNFTATITKCYLDTIFQTTIVGEGSARTPQITVISLTVRGPTPGSNPVLTYSDLTLTNSSLPPASQNAVLQLATTALESSSGVAAIVQAINDILNNSSPLDSLSQMMTNGFTSALDDIFSSVPPGGLPSDGGQQPANDLDLYLFDRTRFAVNNSASGFYLPWQIAASANPVLDPYVIASISIPDQTIGQMRYTDISLTDVSIANVSNAVAPDPTLQLLSPVISAVLAIATLEAGPSKTFNRGGSPVTMDIPPSGPAVLSGGFSFTQCGVMKVTVSGTATISITSGLLTTTVAPSGADASSLQLTVQSLTLDLSKATISVSVDTGDPLTDSIAAQFLENPSIVSQIAGGINGQISGQLSQLSQEFTSAAQSIINQQLKG